MTELGDSLERMSFVQLLLLFAFVTSYVLALGGMLAGPARRKAALLALALAVAFAAMTEPWVHGALLMAFVVAGLGVFVLSSWILVWLLGARHARPVPVQVPVADAASPAAAATPQLEEPATSAAPPVRARASRV